MYRWLSTMRRRRVIARRRTDNERYRSAVELLERSQGVAMSGLTKDEIVELTGYPADLVLGICRDAGVSGD
jgi:hypothetical protein